MQPLSLPEGRHLVRENLHMRHLIALTFAGPNHTAESAPDNGRHTGNAEP